MIKNVALKSNLALVVSPYYFLQFKGFTDLITMSGINQAVVWQSSYCGRTESLVSSGKESIVY